MLYKVSTQQVADLDIRISRRTQNLVPIRKHCARWMLHNWIQPSATRVSYVMSVYTCAQDGPPLDPMSTFLRFAFTPMAWKKYIFAENRQPESKLKGRKCLIGVRLNTFDRNIEMKVSEFSLRQKHNIARAHERTQKRRGAGHAAPPV